MFSFIFFLKYLWLELAKPIPYKVYAILFMLVAKEMQFYYHLTEHVHSAALSGCVQ